MMVILNSAQKELLEDENWAQTSSKEIMSWAELQNIHLECIVYNI